MSSAGKPFHSATSFSIHCKRMQTPNKQGDDGWKSVLYEGQPLEMYRRRYSGKPRTPQPRRNSASAQDGDEVSATLQLPSPAPWSMHLLWVVQSMWLQSALPWASYMPWCNLLRVPQLCRDP